MSDTPGAPGEARAIGVLYLDSREKGRLLSDAARAALETLAAEASVAIENARLYREATEKARMDEELRIASQIQQALLPQARKTVGFCEAHPTTAMARGPRRVGATVIPRNDRSDERPAGAQDRDHAAGRPRRRSGATTASTRNEKAGRSSAMRAWRPASVIIP